MIHRILPSQDRGPRRPARIGDRKVAVKCHGLIHESPHVRQIDVIRKGTVQAICPQLINNDEQDISRVSSFDTYLDSNEAFPLQIM